MKCYYCSEVGHYKNDCDKFKEEVEQLFCTHCDAHGHDEHSCGKLHLDLVPVLKKVQKGSTTSLDMPNMLNWQRLEKTMRVHVLFLTLMCIMSDQGGELEDL